MGLAALRVAEKTGLKKAALRGTAVVGERRAVVTPAWWKAGARQCPVGAMRRRAEAVRLWASAPVVGAAMWLVVGEAMRLVGVETMLEAAEGYWQPVKEVVVPQPVVSKGKVATE
jgi:hypothetical protein